jgi:hypothetical protein
MRPLNPVVTVAAVAFRPPDPSDLLPPIALSVEPMTSELV